MLQIWFTTRCVNSLNFNYQYRMPSVLRPAYGQLAMAMASFTKENAAFNFFPVKLNIAEKCTTKIDKRFFQLDEQLLCCQNQLPERFACL